MKTTALQVRTPQGSSGSVLSGAEDYISVITTKPLLKQLSAC